MNKEFDPQEVYNHVVAVEKASKAIRAVIDRRIFDNPETHPLPLTRDICLSLLRGSSAFIEMGLEGKHARGCVAEIMLEQVMKIWLKDYHIPGTVISNVMLPLYPRTPSRTETTQLDILTVTDRAIFVCECKSYAGDKTTDGEVVKSRDIDLYPWKQNRGHIVAIKNNINTLLPNVNLPDIYNVVYFFADGKFTEWKNPDEEQDILLVNYGCLSTLNNIYNKSTIDGLGKEDIRKIEEYCKSKIPTVEEQADHILRLEKII